MATGLLSCGEQSLPNELVLLILDQLEHDFKSLGRLARTCSALQHLAEQKLYRLIELDTVKDLQRVISAFDGRKERARAVQDLKLQYQYKPNDLTQFLETRTTFNKHVVNMVDLRHWYIESPYDNFNWDKGTGGQDWVTGDMELFRSALEHACTHGSHEADRIQAESRIGGSLERQVGLAQLQSLTIHSHGPQTDFWDLGGFHCLFNHPALRRLHVSCVAFPDDIPELHSTVRQTPLKHLTFDECVLSPTSLKIILSTPANLEHVTLGENVFNNKRSHVVDPVLSKSPQASLDALSVVAHSLRSLVHYDPSWRESVLAINHVQRLLPKSDGLRYFHKLKSVQCEMTSFLYRATILNPQLAPPNLETLRLSRHWDTLDDFFDQLPDCQHYLSLPSLTRLELSQASFLWDAIASPSYICDSDRLRARHAFAYRLFKAGINLVVMVEMHSSPRFIPPYLQNESIPVDWVLYDAGEIGFRRRISDEVPELVQTDVTLPNDILLANTPREVEDAPETDALGDTDVHAMRGKVRRALDQLKHLLVRQRRPRGGVLGLLGLGAGNNGDDYGSDLFPSDDEDEDDMDDDLDLDLDEDFLDEEDLDEMHEALMEELMDEGGVFFVDPHEVDTDPEDEEGSEAWADALQDATTHPDLD